MFLRWLPPVAGRPLHRQGQGASATHVEAASARVLELVPTWFCCAMSHTHLCSSPSSRLVAGALPTGPLLGVPFPTEWPSPPSRSSSWSPHPQVAEMWAGGSFTSWAVCGQLDACTPTAQLSCPGTRGHVHSSTVVRCSRHELSLDQTYTTWLCPKDFR